MNNIFIDYPKQYNGCNLTAFGTKHPEVEAVSSLIDLKHKRSGVFVVEGLWAYEKIMLSNIRVLYFLFVPSYIKTEKEFDIVCRFIPIAKSAGYISEKLSQKLSDRDDTEGFFAVCEKEPLSLSDIELNDNTIISILDSLEKPGNIGTILRSVEGAGGNGVISVNNKVHPDNHRLIKASMGGYMTLPYVVADIKICGRWLLENNFTVVLTQLDAETFYYEPKYNGKIAIVTGNEIRGISDFWDNFTGKKISVKIPMFGHCDSLNAGFATTMTAYHISLKKRGLIT